MTLRYHTVPELLLFVERMLQSAISESDRAKLLPLVGHRHFTRQEKGIITTLAAKYRILT